MAKNQILRTIICVFVLSLSYWTTAIANDSNTSMPILTVNGEHFATSDSILIVANGTKLDVYSLNNMNKLQTFRTEYAIRAISYDNDTRQLVVSLMKHTISNNIIIYDILNRNKTSFSGIKRVMRVRKQWSNSTTTTAAVKYSGIFRIDGKIHTYSHHGNIQITTPEYDSSEEYVTTYVTPYNMVHGYNGLNLIEIYNKNIVIRSLRDFSIIRNIPIRTYLYNNQFVCYPNNKMLIVGLPNRKMLVTNFDSEEIRIEPLEYQTTPIRSISVNGGGLTIAGHINGDISTFTLSDNDMVMVNTISTGQNNPITSVDIDDRNNIAVSAIRSRDISGIIKVWNIQNGELITTLENHGSYIDNIKISNNDQLIISGNSRIVNVYRLPNIN